MAVVEKLFVPLNLSFGCCWGWKSSIVIRTSANVVFPPAAQARNAAPAVINAAAIQARTYAADAKATPTEVSSILEQRIRGVQEEAGLAETGRVLSVGYVGPTRCPSTTTTMHRDATTQSIDTHLETINNEL